MLYHKNKVASGILIAVAGVVTAQTAITLTSGDEVVCLSHGARYLMCAGLPPDMSKSRWSALCFGMWGTTSMWADSFSGLPKYRSW
jgi:hypothetical protein